METVTVIGIIVIVILVFLGLVWSWIACSDSGNKYGYRQGQIDYANGKIKYRKETNEDQETVWTEIKEPETQPEK